MDLHAKYPDNVVSVNKDITLHWGYKLTKQYI